MTQKKPPAQIGQAKKSDPYSLRTLDQIIGVMNNGEFRGEVQVELNTLKDALKAHIEDHPGAPCKGSFSLKLDFEVKQSGDTVMSGAVEIKRPKPPAAMGSAWLSETGELSLGTPMMRRMQSPVRDVDSYDSETGEIRDID